MDREFTNDFWKEKVDWKDSGDLDGNHKVVRCNGNHYWIGHEGFSHNHFAMGHGGAKVRITFTAGPHKGQVIDTNNLWSQGEIDEEFRELLPDNAEIDWMYHYSWFKEIFEEAN